MHGFTPAASLRRSVPRGPHSSLSVIVPRLDQADPFWNSVQSATRSYLPELSEERYITGIDPKHPDPPLFSISRAFNEGASRALTGYLLFGPVDFILHHWMIPVIEAVLDEHPWWHPFGAVHRLGEADSKLVHAGHEFTHEQRIAGAHIIGNSDSMIAMRAEVFFDVRGFDPRFSGFSHEDYVMQQKLSTLYGPPPPPMPFAVVELWGPHGEPGAEYEANNEHMNTVWAPAFGDPVAMRAQIQAQPLL